MSASTHTLSVLICALGGEGGGVLNEWLVDIARRAGYAAQGTSVPGVAQRTGATTYYFELCTVPITQLDGRRPLFCLNPVPGALDAVVSSELLESARCASNGLPSPDRTLMITSSARTLTNAERSHLGDGRLDSAALLALVQSCSRAHHVLDMQRLAAEHGTAISSVMLGAIAASGLLPFDRAFYVDAIRAGERGVPQSLAGFDAAFKSVAEARARAEAAQRLVEDALAAPPQPAPPMKATQVTRAGSKVNAASAPMPSADATVDHSTPDHAMTANATANAHTSTSAALAAKTAEFPSAVRSLVALGLARLLDYQDAAYGELYLQRLRSLRDAEASAPGHAGLAFDATHEAARWLALWMAYDDIARVADLKSRAGRHARVRREAGAGAHDLLRFYDHFKPGAAEVADLLPAPLARRLRQADRQRLAEGRDPWAFPLKLASHTITGTLALRVLAMAKWIRRYSSRYAAEQALINEWLSTVKAGLQEDAGLGAELARCGRLIKGYGSTSERGRERLLHVVRELAPAAFGTVAARVEAIARVRAAALADEGGQAFARALADVGAPPPAPRVQPIRWMPRPQR